jgi:hypothetical protein
MPVQGRQTVFMLWSIRVSYMWLLQGVFLTEVDLTASRVFVKPGRKRFVFRNNWTSCVQLNLSSVIYFVVESNMMSFPCLCVLCSTICSCRCEQRKSLMLMVNVVCVRLFQKPFQVIAQIRVQEADLNARSFNISSPVHAFWKLR